MSDEKGGSGFLQNLTKKQKIVFGVASTLVLVAVAVVSYLGITGKLKIGAATEFVPTRSSIPYFFTSEGVTNDKALGWAHKYQAGDPKVAVSTLDSFTGGTATTTRLMVQCVPSAYSASYSANNVTARNRRLLFTYIDSQGNPAGTVTQSPCQKTMNAQNLIKTQYLTLSVDAVNKPYVDIEEQMFSSDGGGNGVTGVVSISKDRLKVFPTPATAPFNPVVSRVPKASEVVVYTSKNYGGVAFSTDKDIPNLRDPLTGVEDRVESVALGSGISSVKLCRGKDYTDTCQSFTDNTAVLPSTLTGSGANTGVSSIQLTKASATGCQLTKNSVTLAVGETTQVRPVSTSELASNWEAVAPDPKIAGWQGAQDPPGAWLINITGKSGGSAGRATTTASVRCVSGSVAPLSITVVGAATGGSSITITPTSATLAPGGAAQTYSITATNPNKYPLDCAAFLGTFDITKLTQKWLTTGTTNATYEVKANADAVIGATGRMRCAFNNTGSDTVAGKFNVDSNITIGTAPPVVSDCKLDPTSVTVAVGATANVKPATGYSLAGDWNQSVPSIAQWWGASGAIVVKGLSEGGPINATVKCQNGKTAALPITVSNTTVITNPPPTDLQISSFTADPTQVPTGGGDTTLSWVLNRDAASCSIDNNIGSVDGKTGTNSEENVPVQADTTYTLTCDGKTATAKVTVAPPTCTIEVSNYVADPTSVALGGTTTLTWNAAVTGSGCANDKVTCTINGTAATSGGTQEPAVVGSNVYALVCSSEHSAPVTKTVTVTATGAGQCGTGQTALPIVTDKWWVKTLNTVPQTGKTLAHIMGSGNLAYFFDGFGTAYGKGESAKATDYVGLGFWAKKNTKDNKEYICVDTASAVGATATKALPHKVLNMVGTPLASVINPHTQLKFKFSSEPAKMYTLDQAFEAGLVKAYFIWDGTKYLSFTNLTRYPSFAKYGYQPYSAAPTALQSSNGAWIATRSTENVTLIVGQ